MFLPYWLLSFEEITRIARQFVAHGVQKIRLTGGEPLLRKHLEILIEQLAALRTTEGKPLKEYVEAFERMLIDNTMRRHKGSIVAVMEELCLPRRTLNEKMAKYGLSRGDYV